MLPVVRPDRNTPVTSVAADVSRLFSSSELRTGDPPVGTWPDEDEARRHAAGRPGLDLTPGPSRSSGSVFCLFLNYAHWKQQRGQFRGQLASSHLCCVQGSRLEAEWLEPLETIRGPERRFHNVKRVWPVLCQFQWRGRVCYLYHSQPPGDYPDILCVGFMPVLPFGDSSCWSYEVWPINHSLFLYYHECFCHTCVFKLLMIKCFICANI